MVCVAHPFSGKRTLDICEQTQTARNSILSQKRWQNPTDKGQWRESRALLEGWIVPDMHSLETVQHLVRQRSWERRMQMPN